MQARPIMPLADGATLSSGHPFDFKIFIDLPCHLRLHQAHVIVKRNVFVSESIVEVALPFAYLIYAQYILYAINKTETHEPSMVVLVVPDRFKENGNISTCIGTIKSIDSSVYSKFYTATIQRCNCLMQ